MQAIAQDLILDKSLTNLDENAKWCLFKQLARYKNHAIKKSYRIFSNLPIEREDLEGIAWMAFEESLAKYETNHGAKGFVSFFTDNVYWRCRDYCQRFVNNHHKILNNANSRYFYEDWNYLYSIENDDWDKKISLKQYYQKLEPGDKKHVFKMLLNSSTTLEITKELYASKTKVYRTMELLAIDLLEIV